MSAVSSNCISCYVSRPVNTIKSHEATWQEKAVFVLFTKKKTGHNL